MELKFSVHTKIRKPLSEVFDAVYNPKKLSGYFTTGGTTGPLDEGKEVVWKFHDYPEATGSVRVKQMIKDNTIVLEWDNIEKGINRAEMTFEALDSKSTLVTIKESGWRKATQESVDESHSHCMGWTQMLCCLKVYVEDGKNLREFFF